MLITKHKLLTKYSIGFEPSSDCATCRTRLELDAWMRGNADSANDSCIICRGVGIIRPSYKFPAYPNIRSSCSHQP